MVAENILLEHFNNVNVDLDADVLHACSAICERHAIDEEEFVDQWMAFCASNGYESFNPSVESVEQFERKVIAKEKLKKLNTVKLEVSTPVRQTPTESNVIFEPGHDVSIPARSKTAYAVRLFHGDDTLLFSAKWRGKGDVPVTVTFKLPGDFKYMNNSIPRTVDVISAYVREIAERIVRVNQLPAPDPMIDGILQAPGTICGVASCKPDATKIFYLRGLADSYTVADDTFIKCESLGDYALFPGEVIVAHAVPIRKNFVKLTKVYTDAAFGNTPRFPCYPHPLEVVVCSGPFTDPKNFMYKPLDDVIAYVKDYQPHVLVLLGPFIDERHKLIEHCPGSLEDFFVKIVGKLSVALQTLNVQIILVPSRHDAHHHPVFPTPPFACERAFKNVHMAPNPAHLDLNGFVLTCCTDNVIGDLLNDGISGGAMTHERVLDVLLGQRTLCPVNYFSSHAVDARLWRELGVFDRIPHALVVPSIADKFITKIRNCVCVNGKFFATDRMLTRFEVHSPKHGEKLTNTKVICQIVSVDGVTDEKLH